MFVTAVCILFLFKLNWLKDKSFYEPRANLEIARCASHAPNAIYMIFHPSSSLRKLETVKSIMYPAAPFLLRDPGNEVCSYSVILDKTVWF